VTKKTDLEIANYLSQIIYIETITALVSVSYAWADNLEVNLYSSDGLSLLQFRTGK